MLPLYKLERLPAGQRRRKIILALVQLERSLIGSTNTEQSFRSGDEDYLRGLATLAIEDPKLAADTIPEISRLLALPSVLLAPSAGKSELLRLCNTTRHALLAAIGSFPAEWDLVVSGSVKDLDLGATAVRRRFYPGISVYAEDIRSPFNLGSIFRTAEAFGAEKLLISPLCVPPTHPRAERSAMGCINYLPWERVALGDLSADIPVFALETGGTPIEEFDFPLQGVIIVGSEELGISSEGLARATYGRVSIPMTGIKASLNVGVAFGILMQAWTAYLRCSDSKPL